MEKIKLNKDLGKMVEAHGYELDAKKEYIINTDDEIEEQANITATVHLMGLPALKDYHNWLISNGFNADFPNPTNEFVSKFYGKNLYGLQIYHRVLSLKLKMMMITI